jgi:hypothetical protein
MTKAEAIRKYLSYKGYKLHDVIEDTNMWIIYEIAPSYDLGRMLDKYFQCTTLFVSKRSLENYEHEIEGVLKLLYYKGFIE